MADDSNGTKSSDQAGNFRIRARPRHILLFSGKRKSGKDFITDALHERLTPAKCKILKLSGPIKSSYAKSHGLDFQELLSDGEYKERYRSNMLKWSESIRNDDYGYFCRAAVDMYDVWDREIWIVSDVRRKTDIRWFVEHFDNVCKTIRIVADEKVRANRGWIFKPGIDDATTECDLDDVVTWDLIVRNDNEDINDVLDKILQLIN